MQPHPGNQASNSDRVDALVAGFLSDLSSLSSQLQSTEPRQGGEAPVERSIEIAATTPEIFSSSAATCHLQPTFSPDIFLTRTPAELTLGDAAELLSEIARSESNADLADCPGTRTGHALVRALHHLAAGDRDAFCTFALLFAREPRGAPIESLIRELGRRFEDSEEMLDIYDSMAAADREDAVVWLLRGWALCGTGRYEESLSLCDRSIQLDPDSACTWCHRGLALLGLGRPEEALHACEQALELDNGSSLAWTVRGFTLAGLARWNESIAALDRSVSMGEDSASVHLKRAQVLLALDRWREGVAALDGALKRSANTAGPAAAETAALIRTLLPGLSSPNILQISIETLFLVYRKHRTLWSLGQGLIDCVPDVLSATEFSDADADMWLESWRNVAGSFPEFEQPLRFLELAVRCRKDRDCRIFVDLPEGQRAALERLTETGKVQSKGKVF